MDNNLDMAKEILNKLVGKTVKSISVKGEDKVSVISVETKEEVFSFTSDDNCIYIHRMVFEK